MLQGDLQCCAVGDQLGLFLFPAGLFGGKGPPARLKLFEIFGPFDPLLISLALGVLLQTDCNLPGLWNGIRVRVRVRVRVRGRVMYLE